MAKSAAGFTARDDDYLDDLHDAAFASRGCCSSFSFPCFRSRLLENWERIPSAGENDPIVRSWWCKGVGALKTARGWSELIAGPRWKNFIRRFNRSGGRSKTAKFRYDPLSYSLNFDGGRGKNWESEGDSVFRDFSSRYSAIPVQNAQINGGTCG